MKSNDGSDLASYNKWLICCRPSLVKIEVDVKKRPKLILKQSHFSSDILQTPYTSLLSQTCISLTNQ